MSLLNNRYRQNGVEFHAVDLRFGINTENMTEEDSENAVLNVCLSMIDSSRPFFIGLIGNRYGWIPSQKQMDAVLAKLKQENLDGEKLSFDEQWFVVSEEELENLQLYARLYETDGSIEGNWRVTVSLENGISAMVLPVD